MTLRQIDPEFIPRHIALVMDGNGRWAQQRGMKRTEGHKRGEAVLMDCVDACIEMGTIEWLSAYAFSTENWRRAASEVRFILGFSRDVLHRQRDELNEKNVRIVWAGRRPRLWRSVLRELEAAEELTQDNTGLTLAMCINYGGRAEIIDGARQLATDARDGKIRPQDINEQTFSKYLYRPDMPDVDLFLRPSGEQRTSNFLLWQSAYAEMVYQDKLFPDFTKDDLFEAVYEYAKRDRRFGGAVDKFAEK
ncbi:isoprenyl transferase [Corynebacterium hadale]|uniref:Isoprenyl transferase n=1 Tax=Corynebacterium hadale TaxID=2026255 RepID=A0A269PFM5_9CORY|nr:MULTISPECIES: isoprenyl transferase [Corynebacterium]PAJ71035.1 isoprenyl transferase [Corynebacterium hadale]PAT06329.1 isoprenyl transferase [Corynebacterium hadale]PAT08297.1 isoprenyl transferase [Corynebacterium hadale]PAT10589.1 isoprenyl transferase [Corynebacterium hadale]PAT14651.1 isoprenyl transferase [Corynebacterium sp. NML 120412]